MRSRYSWIFLATIFLFATICSDTYAQENYSADGRIPESSTAVIIATPKSILSTPSMELVPRELISAFSKRELDIDFCEISKATLVVDAFDDLRDPPSFALTLEFDSEQSLKEEILEDAQQEELNGNPLYKFGGRENVVLYLPDSKTMVMGMEDFVKESVASKDAKGPLAEMVAKSGDAKGHIRAFVVMDPIRDFIDGNLPPKDQLPFPVQPFRDLPDDIESVRVSLAFADESESTFTVRGIDEKATDSIVRTIKHGISTGRGMLMSYVANEMSEQPKMMEAIEAYDERVGDKLEEMLQPTRNGNDLVFSGDDGDRLTNAATIGTLVGMLLPAVQQTREAARRTQSMNNLRQIALACLNYESAYMRFPKNICDEDGNPLLSWRVAILPFIEENRLYQEFHLDEPWDSEHNIELLDRMPAVLRNPNFDSDSKTVYLGFEGEGTIFDPGEDELGFGDITDGSSNTILCVEANENAGIEWSKPSDIEFDPEKESTEIGSARPGGFSAALCDGSTHFLSKSFDWDLLKNLIQRNDGNIANINDL